jgi:acetyl esterase/lipase
LTKNGDSLYVNEGIDRKIVTYDGFITAAAKLYANGTDLKNPGLSPVYGDFSGFPPTMLVTGTRDLFLSLTVRVHRKMKAAGVVADLNVYEGLSHVEYFVVPDAPESIEVYSELKKFLKQYLQ